MQIKAWITLGIGLLGVLTLGWALLRAGAGDGALTPLRQQVASLEDTARTLSTLPTLESLDRPLPETYWAVLAFVEQALPALKMRGAVKPVVEVGRPIEAAMQPTEWTGVHRLLLEIILEDYGTYGGLVALLRALLLQYPMVLDRLTFDGRSLTLGGWLYGH